MLDYLKLIYYLLRPNTIFIQKSSGALGDDLLMSIVLPKLKEKYPDHKIIVEANWCEFFVNNPYVDWVTSKHLKTTKRHLKPKYLIDVNNDDAVTKQFMKSINLSGDGRPKLYLTALDTKTISLKYGFPYIVISPVGKVKFSSNRKEWGFENFQTLIDLLPGYRFIQTGGANDPLLKNVIDERGLALLKTAALIKNSLFFIGLEGGLMHLSQAVGKKAAIIYGGSIKIRTTGYSENLNIANTVHCSPCFHSTYKHTPCETMECMKGILPSDVAGQIHKHFKTELASL